MLKSFCFILSFLSFCLLYAQNHTRFTATYSTKEIDTSNIQKISIGNLYLDNTSKTLRFNQKFPDTRSYTLRDSILIVQKKDTSFKVPSPRGLLEYNIYNIILSGNLHDFGITKYGYKLKSLEEQEGLVIMHYETPISVKGRQKHTVDLVKKAGKLDAFLVYDAKKILVSQTFFKEYIVQSGLQIPQKIVQIAHFGKKQNKKITSLSKILIDEKTNSNLYNP